MNTELSRPASAGQILVLLIAVACMLLAAITGHDSAVRFESPVATVARSSTARSDTTPGTSEAEPILTILPLGESVQSRPLAASIIGQGTDACLLMASIHGNENRGTPLLRRLERFMVLNMDLISGRQVVIYSVANPDGVAADSRLNANGVDLNRNFPAENRENRPRYGTSALSEPEAVAIQRLIEMISPSRIVSLHEPLNAVDYDGPAQPLAEAMAEYCPLVVRKLGTRPGSLGAYAGELLQVPIVTLEFPESARQASDQQLWIDYAPALLAAILYPEPLTTESIRRIERFETGPAEIPTIAEPAE